MKFVTILSAATLGLSTASSPAIIWKKSRGSVPVKHDSEAIDASDLITSVLSSKPSEDSSLAAVVFVVGRDKTGAESVSRLASAGSLPNIASKYNDAETIHHSVFGVEGARYVSKQAARQDGMRSMEASFEDLERKLSGVVAETVIGEDGSVIEKLANKRARSLAVSNVLVLKVSPDSHEELDAAVVSAIEHSDVENVILMSARSAEEMKLTKTELLNRKNGVLNSSGPGRRRLDDANNNDGSYVNYVSSTPNIFSGVLFTFFFLFVVKTGLGCMGMIEGPDIHTEKMPIIGKEA